MLPDWTLIGFSGHRELGDPAVVTEAISAALDRVAARRGPLAVVCSAASGADTLFLEAVSRRSLPFFLLLPFRRARFQQDFAPRDWQRVQPLLERALHVEELGETETPEEAYLETGVRVADRCDILLAVWDGQPARGRGGTAEVVAYARELGKPLILIDPASGRFTEERMEAFPPGGAPGAWNGRPREAVESQFAALDTEAMASQPRARKFFTRIIVLHLLAAFLAVLAFLPIPIALATAFIFFELLLLSYAGVLAGQHRQAHYSWVHSRIGAELCRSFLGVWHLRGRMRPLAPVGGPALARLYHSLWLAWYLDPPELLALAEARGRYLRQRIADQLAYYRHKLAEATPRLRWLMWFARNATRGAIAFASIALVLSFIAWMDWRAPIIFVAQYVPWLGDEKLSIGAMKLFAVFLPLLSAGVLSHVVSQDYKRRVVRYSEVVALLEDAARRLGATRTWASLTRIVEETEVELLHEIVEWQSLTRFAGEAH